MSRPPCFEKAVDLLARRPHFRRELERKLAGRGYEAPEVAAVLGRLREFGYLDDRALAGDWVEARLRRGGVGRRRLQADLERKGVDGGLAASVLAEKVPEDDRSAAREAAEKWRRTRSTALRNSPTRKQVLARHLGRKGFSQRAIFSVLNETEDDEEQRDSPELS